MSLLVLLAAALSASAPKHFDVAASFMAPSRNEGVAAVAVLFSPLDPDVHVNEDPAPRLELEAGQKVLVDKQPPAPSRGGNPDPDTTRYLDLRRPVKFPVAIAKDAGRGSKTVRAKVVFYYCSKREAWCRRGSAPLELTVDVP